MEVLPIILYVLGAVLLVALIIRYLKSKSLTNAKAILVLPIPGLPYKIMENNFLFLTRLDNTLPLPQSAACCGKSDTHFKNHLDGCFRQARSD